jgi:hypothetical protein
MLLKHGTLRAIADGRVTLAFRRWTESLRLGIACRRAARLFLVADL